MYSGGVVADDQSSSIVVALDLHGQRRGADGAKLLGIAEKALERVVDKLRHRVPRSVVEMAQDREDADARPDAYVLVGRGHHLFNVRRGRSSHTALAGISLVHSRLARMTDLLRRVLGGDTTSSCCSITVLHEMI